jgi:hypothetical protein
MELEEKDILFTHPRANFGCDFFCMSKYGRRKQRIC